MNETSVIPDDQPVAEKKSWRRFPRGRTAMAAGAAVAGLAIGGAGFGAGYAVADHGSTTQQTTTFTPGERGFPGGDMGEQMGTPPDGAMGGTGDSGGTTGQAPDFDGDGQPDTTAPDTGTDSSSDQQS